MVSMTKAMTVGLFMTLTALWSPLAQAAFVREPWIQDATATSVTVAWEAGTAGGTQNLVYGAGTAMDTTVAGTLVSSKLYTATVTSLPSSSNFSYKVVSGADQSTPGSFVTAPEGREPFRFGVTGDNRTDNNGHANVVAATLPFAPDFMLNTGDIVDATNYTTFFSIEKELLRNAVIFPSPGNHDTPSQYQYGFNRPNYYSFRWGNAFYLSVNTDGDYSAGSAQLQWVEQQLQAASADETIDWIIAYHHHPVYSSGSHGNTAEVIATLNPLYLQYGVDVVFNGHDHNYERIERDNVVYVVTGGGGVSPRSMETAVSGQVIAESVRHITIVDIDGGVLTLRAYRPDGSLLDERVIEKGPPTGENPTDPTDPTNPDRDPRVPSHADEVNSIAGGCACSLDPAAMGATNVFGMSALSLGALGAFLRRRRR